MPLNLSLTQPQQQQGFGLNFGTLSSIAQKAPVVGGIVSNLASVGKAVGIKIDTTTPAQHIRERTAKGEALKAAAIAGSDIAWEKLWTASSRALPVQRVDSVPRLADKQFIGWPRVGEILTAMLREVENARGALPKPTGASTQQVISMSTDTVLTSGALVTASQGGTFGGMGFGIGDSPQQHSVAQSNGAPSSTNYVVVGGLILAMLLILRKRR